MDVIVIDGTPIQVIVRESGGPLQQTGAVWLTSIADMVASNYPQKNLFYILNEQQFFDYESGLTSFDNGMTFEAQGVGSGGYRRRASYIKLEWYGISTSQAKTTAARPDLVRLVANNTAKVQAAINYAAANNIQDLYWPQTGSYYYDRPVFIKSNLNLHLYNTSHIVDLSLTTADDGAGYFQRARVFQYGFFQQVDFAQAARPTYTNTANKILAIADDPNNSGYVCRAGAESIVLTDSSAVQVGEIVGIRSDLVRWIPKAGPFAGSEFLRFYKVIGKVGNVIQFERPIEEDVLNYPRVDSSLAIDGPNRTFLFRFGATWTEPAAGTTNYGDQYISEVYCVMNVRTIGGTFVGGADCIARSAAFECEWEGTTVQGANAGIIVNGFTKCTFEGEFVDIKGRIVESAEGSCRNRYIVRNGVGKGVRSYRFKSNENKVTLREDDYFEGNITLLEQSYVSANTNPTLPTLNPAVGEYQPEGTAKGNFLRINGANCTVNASFAGYTAGNIMTAVKGGLFVTPQSSFDSWPDSAGVNACGNAITLSDRVKSAIFSAELTNTPEAGEVYFDNPLLSLITRVRVARTLVGGLDITALLQTFGVGDTYIVLTFEEGDTDFVEVGRAEYTISSLSTVSGSPGYVEFNFSSVNVVQDATITQGQAVGASYDKTLEANNCTILAKEFNVEQDATSVGRGLMRLNGNGNVVQSRFVMNTSTSSPNNRILSNGTGNKVVNCQLVNQDFEIASEVARANAIYGNTRLSGSTIGMTVQGRFVSRVAHVVMAQSADTLYVLGDNPQLIGAGGSNIVLSTISAVFGNRINTRGTRNGGGGFRNLIFSDQSFVWGLQCEAGGLSEQVLHDGLPVSILTASGSSFELDAAPTGAELANGDIVFTFDSSANPRIIGAVESLSGNAFTVTGYNAETAGIAVDQFLYRVQAANLGNNASAFGNLTKARHASSFTSGIGTVTTALGQTVSGRYNDPATTPTNARVIWGNGTNSSNLKTAGWIGDKDQGAWFDERLRHLAPLRVVDTAEVTLLSEDSGGDVVVNYNGSKVLNLPTGLPDYFAVTVLNDGGGSGNCTITPLTGAQIVGVSGTLNLAHNLFARIRKLGQTSGVDNFYVVTS